MKRYLKGINQIIPLLTGAVAVVFILSACSVDSVSFVPVALCCASAIYLGLVWFVCGRSEKHVYR